eukprot:g3803.t1
MSGLSALRREPARIQNEILKLDENLNSVCLDHYNAFIINHETFRYCERNVNELQSDLTEISDKVLPEFSKSCELFREKGARIARDHGENVKTLTQHTHLLELLEIPQLVETCLRNALFEEALSLLSFANVLESRHSDESLDSNKIVRGVVNEVRECIPSLRSILLRKLSGNLKLPECLSLVSHLKRLEQISKSSDSNNISKDFIACREANMRRAIRSAKYKDASERLLGMIELNRVHWFDIITQHRAIFVNSNNDLTILSRWVQNMTRDFLKRLSEHLQGVSEGSVLSNAMETCMYFGKSLGRVGADFSALVPHVFQMRMYDMVKLHLERGLETFEKDLRDIFKQEDTSLTLDITAPDLQDITSTPPSTLLVFPFVAALTNTFLSAFNELRHCAVLTLQDQLLDVLQKILIRMVQTLIKFKEEETQALYKKNNELRFKHLLKIIHVQFVPKGVLFN